MFTDNTITLRALEIIDVDTLYNWENDPSLWTLGATIAPYSRKQLWDYINNYDGDIYSAKQLRLMIDLNSTGETIGTIDLYDFDAANSRCGIGILIAKPYQHKGYGLRALQLIANYCRDIYSLHQIYAIVAQTNQPSRGLFDKASYTVSGCLKSWIKIANRYYDAYIYQQFI